MTVTPEQRDAAFQAMLQEWNNHVRRLNFHWCPSNEKAFILQNALDALIALGWQLVPEGSVVVPKEPTAQEFDTIREIIKSTKWLGMPGGRTMTEATRDVYRAMIGAKGE